jgi:CBS domain containing-hemolysin-like protein
MSAAAGENSIIAVIRSVLFTLLCLWLALCVFKTLPSLAAQANVFNGCCAIMTAHWGIAHALAYCPIGILYLLAILAPNWPWCKWRLWEPAPFLWWFRDTAEFSRKFFTRRSHPHDVKHQPLLPHLPRWRRSYAVWIELSIQETCCEKDSSRDPEPTKRACCACAHPRPSGH